MNNSDSFEVKSLEFPKVYKRTFSDFFDKRYYSTLFSSLAVHALLVIYFLLNPFPLDKSDQISQIHERFLKTLQERAKMAKARTTKFEFASRVPDKPVEEIKEVVKPKKSSVKKESSAPKTVKVEPKKSAISDKEAKLVEREARRARARARRSSNKELAASMGSKGLLGLLTSTSTIAHGAEVENILGEAGRANQDLDKALANLSGITVGGPKVRGAGSGSVKGGRATGNSDIGDLVGGLGDAQSGSIERTGDLVVVTGESSVEGTSKGGMAGRTPEDVQMVVLKHNNSIQYCYDRELRRNPNLKGKVIVRFTITPQGTVKNVKVVSSNLGNRKVESCIVSRVRRWSDFGPIDRKFGDTTIKQVYAFGY